MENFSTFCTGQNVNFKSLFDLYDMSCKNTPQFLQFVFEEFKKTRLHFGSLSNTFKTFADIKKLESINVSVCWEIIEKHLGDFPNDPINYKNIKIELTEIGLSTTQIENAIEATKLLHQVSHRSLQLNVKTLSQSKNRKLGILGELFAFLYSRDIQKTDCLYHKLIPDNPNSTRPGLDLLAVCFANNPDEDEVHFWEAKSTLSDFTSQQYKIVNWFNEEKEKAYLSMVIEAARINWEQIYTRDKFNRANIALARFQANLKNFKFIGSISYDSNIMPEESSIMKFNDIKVDRSNKQLVMFKTENLEELVNEMYDRVCKT